ncbi:hypothetical protein AOT82_2222 [Psychrobacter sp. AntiMn-1]|nr:hypothetical protein AOT82_2222 [Psychrobacter sp. AntiMn-1]
MNDDTIARCLMIIAAIFATASLQGVSLSHLLYHHNKPYSVSRFINLS